MGWWGQLFSFPIVHSGRRVNSIHFPADLLKHSATALPRFGLLFSSFSFIFIFGHQTNWLNRGTWREVKRTRPWLLASRLFCLVARDKSVPSPSFDGLRFSRNLFAIVESRAMNFFRGRLSKRVVINIYAMAQQGWRGKKENENGHGLLLLQLFNYKFSKLPPRSNKQSNRGVIRRFSKFLWTKQALCVPFLTNTNSLPLPTSRAGPACCFIASWQQQRRRIILRPPLLR